MICSKVCPPMVRAVDTGNVPKVLWLVTVNAELYSTFSLFQGRSMFFKNSFLALVNALVCVVVWFPLVDTGVHLVCRSVMAGVTLFAQLLSALSEKYGNPSGAFPVVIKAFICAKKLASHVING